MLTLKCLLLNALLSGSINALAQNNITQGQLQQTIGQLDRAHATAIFKGDSLALDSLMDDEVTVNHPTNRIVKEKNELLSLIRQGIIRYTTFERTPELFLFYENTVVVMGNEQVTPAPGAPNAGKLIHRRYTNIWMNKNGKWRLVARHANNACERL